MDNDILIPTRGTRKSLGLLCPGTEMNYQLVQQLQEKGIPAQHSCRVLEASRAGYYGALERGKERKKLCTLTVQIKSVFAASGRCYGSRRLCRELNEQGVLIGRYKVRRLIRDHQLKPYGSENSRTPRTVNITWRSLKMYSTGSLRKPPPTKPGLPILPIYARVAAGSIWRRSWICFPGK
jgi:hypothetical protein